MEELHQKVLVRRWVKQRQFFEKPTNDDVEVWEAASVDGVVVAAVLGEEVGLVVVEVVVAVVVDHLDMVLLRDRGHPMVLRVNMDLDERVRFSH